MYRGFPILYNEIESHDDDDDDEDDDDDDDDDDLWPLTHMSCTLKWTLLMVGSPFSVFLPNNFHIFLHHSIAIYNIQQGIPRDIHSTQVSKFYQNQ